MLRSTCCFFISPIRFGVHFEHYCIVSYIRLFVTFIKYLTFEKVNENQKFRKDISFHEATRRSIYLYIPKDILNAHLYVIGLEHTANAA